MDMVLKTAHIRTAILAGAVICLAGNGFAQSKGTGDAGTANRLRMQKSGRPMVMTRAGCDFLR